MPKYNCRVTMSDGRIAFVSFIKHSLSWNAKLNFTYSANDSSPIDCDDLETVMRLIQEQPSSHSIRMIEFILTGGQP